MNANEVPALADIGFAAADEIIAANAPEGRAAFNVYGNRDGSLSVVPFRDYPGNHVPSVVVNYAGDSYDAEIGGEAVSGAIHTLRAVLGRRLARIAARIPANYVAP